MEDIKQSDKQESSLSDSRDMINENQPNAVESSIPVGIPATQQQPHLQTQQQPHPQAQPYPEQHHQQNPYRDQYQHHNQTTVVVMNSQSVMQSQPPVYVSARQVSSHIQCMGMTSSIRANCPNCEKLTTTKTSCRCGSKVWLISLLLCLPVIVGFPPICYYLPFCVPS